jgi:hypothetical protein
LLLACTTGRVSAAPVLPQDPIAAVVGYVAEAYVALSSRRERAAETARTALRGFTAQLSPLEEYTSGFAQVGRGAKAFASTESRPPCAVAQRTLLSVW